jgi:hypothetical protein
LRSWPPATSQSKPQVEGYLNGVPVRLVPHEVVFEGIGFFSFFCFAKCLWIFWTDVLDKGAGRAGYRSEGGMGVGFESRGCVRGMGLWSVFRASINLAKRI